MQIARDHGLPNEFEKGHRPRHFAGALDRPDSVEVLLLLAEPGSNPGHWEIGRKIEDWLYEVCSDGLGKKGGHPFIYDPIHPYTPDCPDRFARWPAEFFEKVFPDLSVEDRMGRVVIANSFWVQAKASGGRIGRRAERDFAPILGGFVRLFPSAIVVAAGGKARARLDLAGVRDRVEMRALTLPEANKPEARQSREAAAKTLRERLLANTGDGGKGTKCSTGS
ncbi:hypothetical protein [Dinoroseobacter sp. S375]|uniref:hypothetical protein n=1 Tax=Dinoroseobacter sp. S375 TaxID=3415136 RepID=UPI003C7A985E